MEQAIDCCYDNDYLIQDEEEASLEHEEQYESE